MGYEVKLLLCEQSHAISGYMDVIGSVCLCGIGNGQLYALDRTKVLVENGKFHPYF